MAERLAAELTATLAEASPPRHILLWFDPAGEFKRLVSAISEAISRSAEIIRYEAGQSQIALKADLLRREANSTATVVYVHGHGPDALLPGDARGDERPILWALADYRYKGATWVGGGEGNAAVPLVNWLERHGVQPSFGSHTDELQAGGPDSLLARYVEMHVRTDPARWPRPLRPDDVRGRLAGNPTDAALLLIVSPRIAAAQWGERTADVMRALSKEYGVSESLDTSEYLRSLVAILALTDAWDAFGRSDDFPFLAALPASARNRDRSLKLLREHVLRRQDASPRYHQIASDLAPKWAAIGPWAKNLSGQPLGLRAIASERVARLIASVDSSTSESRSESRERLGKAMHSWPSDRSTWVDPMRTVGSAVDLLDRVWAAGEALATLHDASLLVEAFSAEDGWNHIDWEYLLFMRASGADPLMAPLGRLVDQLYVGWISSANERFSKLVEAADEWPLPETELSPAPEWVASTKNRRAVIVTDAMRLDVAREVARHLPDAELEAGLSTLPTTTPFGMAALLPHGGELVATVVGKKLVLREGSSKHELHTRDGRSAWLAEALSKRSQSVVFVELKALIEGKKMKSADLTVVYDYRLDDAGHGQGSVPDEVEGHVARLARAVSRLHDLGIGTVDVVTDHGFLHQPPDLVEALGKPPVLPGQVHYRAARYAVLKPDAPVDSLIRVKSPLVPELALGFARGIRTLEMPSNYLHGGISLQECIIGRIRSVRTLGATSFGVSITVPATQLPTGTVAVQIAPEVEGQMTLAAPPPRRVTMWIADSSGREVSDRLECQVGWDAPSQTIALYLREGAAIPAGSTLRLSAIDAETGEALHSENLALLVDWE